MQVPDDIRQLVDEYLTLGNSQENARRKPLWEPRAASQDQWHGIPRDGIFRTQRVVPITVDLQPSFWWHLFPHDFSRSFWDPVPYLRFHLQRRIAQFRMLEDDTLLDGVIPVYLSTPFETSLYGLPAVYFPEKDPVIDAQPVIHGPSDLDKLEPIDFYESGMMPQAHRIYEGLREMVGDGFTILFPEWIRGAFGMAIYLRGFEQLLVDCMLDPSFAYQLMDSVTQARMTWFTARAKHLGEEVSSASLFNDEVDSAVIGPQHYRQSILPHEKTLAAFHGCISYWHSCGNIGPMARDIVEVGCIDLLDVSGWTDLEAVLSSLPGPAPRLEVRLHPLRDCQQAGPDWMAQRVRQVVETCLRYDVASFTLRVSGLQVMTTPQEDMARIRQWIEIARRSIDQVLGGRTITATA